MFKKWLISIVALSVGTTGAFGAASVRAIGTAPSSAGVGAVTRAGTLRMHPTTTVGGKSVSTAGATVSGNSSGTNTARMSSISGITGVGAAKPKLSSSASAATLADLKKQVADLANVVSDMLSAGVDEKAVRDIIDSELAAKNFATSDELKQKADKEDVISSDVTFTEENGYIVLTSGKTKTNVIALSDIQGGQGTPGANACEPKYSAITNSNGDTEVTIKCADDESKVLGQYTVAKGADGSNPCPNGLELVEDSSYEDSVRAKKYDLVCNE